MISNPNDAAPTAPDADSSSARTPSPKEATTAASERLRRALRWLARRSAAAQRRAAAGSLEVMSAAAFRAVVAARLQTLERDVAEMRARINGLLFVVAGAVITQVVLRLIGV
ncbi:MAG: hypothetical protein ACREMU_00385 [Gemmatimonadaceae bacterium]